MIGLMVEGKPLVRAYSIASPSWDDELEFYSIKVQDGPLTSRLQHLARRRRDRDAAEAGRHAGARRAAAGQAAVPVRHRHRHRALRLDRSATRRPTSKFEQVVLTHTCRQVAELDYGHDLIARIRGDEMLAEMVGDKLTHIATTTREPSPRHGPDDRLDPRRPAGRGGGRRRSTRRPTG